MSIRRILQLSLLITVISIGLMTATLIESRKVYFSNSSATLNLNAVERKIALIRGFLPELTGLSHRRATQQWQTQYKELTPMLASIPVVNGHAKALKNNIMEEHYAVGSLFDKLATMTPSPASKTNLDILAGQLNVRTASMVSDVLAIDDLTITYYIEQEQMLLTVKAAAVFALSGVIIGLLLLLYRRVVLPVFKLEQASAQFSQGKLDQALMISGNDEISSLAASFEYMRQNLRARISELDAARHLIDQENERLAQRVEERTAELRAANQELDSFAYAVSHDLRAPLRAMSGFSQALIEDYGDQFPNEAHDYLNQINIATQRMGELISGLLLLSRSTRSELRHDNIDLSALANRILADLARTSPQREVTCKVEPDLSAKGDTNMIEAALRNLLDNAWKFTQRTAKATIRFYSKQQDGQCYFCVSDNGVGFDMAHAGKLFQPFQRLHRQEEFPGTGIGLATVQRIIHRHGGVINAESAPGKGATFCFYLPPADTTTIKETS